MGGGNVPRKGSWSWTRLVREFGEEEAFARLPYMSGLGDYNGHETARVPEVAYELPQVRIAFNRRFHAPLPSERAWVPHTGFITPPSMWKSAVTSRPRNTTHAKGGS